MNKIEKRVFDLVKSAPWLKFLIRNLYQTLFDLLPKPKEFSVHPINYKQGFFFGFHDQTPFSSDGKRILANQLSVDLRMPEHGEVLNVGFFVHNSGVLRDYKKIGESDAWNYHKGCRLQWVNDDEVIFNTAIKKRLVSKIINIQKDSEKIIDFPVDTVSPNGNFATSFSYERLQELMPGYGYNYSDNGFLDENAPPETGLFIVDLKENKRKLLVSLKELASTLENENDILSYKHYVTHSEFSTDGKYISFLHRWTKTDIRDRSTELIIYDLQNNSHLSLPTDGMVSHYIWNKKNEIIAYCRYQGNDSHVIFDIPKLIRVKPIAKKILNSDGHQSFVSNSQFVTDTYPDRYRMAKIYKCDMNTEEVHLLASLYSPKKFQTKDFKKHIACDFHPRMSPDGKFVCFDSIRNDKRSLCVMQI